MAEPTVTGVSDTVYLDRRNQAVKGFNVEVYIPDYNEFHTFQLPDIKPETVKPAVAEYVKYRAALAKIGTPSS